jgi:WD40 repeat protein
MINAQCLSIQITCVRYSEELNILLTASHDRTVRVWTIDTADSTPLKCIAVMEHEHGVGELSCSFVWSDLHLTIVSHIQVTSCAFVSRGFIATATGGFWKTGDEEITDPGDQTIRIWDIASPNSPVPYCICLFCANYSLQSLAACGDTIIAGGKRGDVYLLNTELEDMEGVLWKRRSAP